MATGTPGRMARQNGEREGESEKRLTCSVIWVHRRRPRELRRSAVCSRPAPGVPIGKFSLLASPPRSRHAPTAVGLLCPFILPFLSSLSTHERFTSRVRDTRPPVLYHDRSSGHDTALYTEFLDRRASILIRRGLGMFMILRCYRRKHDLEGKISQSYAKHMYDDKSKYLYAPIFPHIRIRYSLKASLVCFSQCIISETFC